MKMSLFSEAEIKLLGKTLLTRSRSRTALIVIVSCAFIAFVSIIFVGGYPSRYQSLSESERPPDWIEWFRPGLSKRPGWCEQLEKEPRARPLAPLHGECGRKGNDVLCADGKPMFFGLKNEDLYLWNRHFRHLNRPGVFFDVAANDPVSRSNTFFYEQCLGWRGVCVEANPGYFRKLRTRRTCALVKRCVSDRLRTVVFSDTGGIGGVMETNKNKWVRKRLLENTRTTECIRTATALTEIGVNMIDFMSLDVEGHELLVLRGIDWKVTKINLIVTESTSEEVRAFLAKKGFVLHQVENQEAFDALRIDRLYVHKRVAWGKPV